MLTKLLISMLTTMSIMELGSKDDVVLDYTTRPMRIEGYPIDELGDIIVVEWDVTKNGYVDLVISCDNCVMRDPRMPHYFTIYESNSDEVYRRLKRGFIFPLDVLLIKDEQGNWRLATTGPFSRERNMFPIIAVEQEGDSRWEMEIIQWMNNETTAEEWAWLQEGRKAAQSITTIYSEEDIAEMKARRQVDAITQVSPEPISTVVTDESATPVIETLPHAKETTERISTAAVAVESLVEFNTGEDSDDYDSDMPVLILLGIATVIAVCLLAILACYRWKAV